MKLISLLVLCACVLAFAPPVQPPTCDTCSTPSSGWSDPPDLCRSVDDNLTCSANTTYCSVSGTLTADSSCDACIRLVFVANCSMSLPANTSGPPPQGHTASETIPCQTNPSCAVGYQAEFWAGIQGTNCTVGAVAWYAHNFLCQ